MQNNTIEVLEQKLYQLIFTDGKSKQIIGEFIDRYGFCAVIHKHYRMNLGTSIQGSLKAIHNIIKYHQDKLTPVEYTEAIAFLTGVPKATLLSLGKAHRYETLLCENSTIHASERQMARIKLLVEFVDGFTKVEQTS